MSCIFADSTYCSDEGQVFTMSRDDVRSLMSETFMSEMLLRLPIRDTVQDTTGESVSDALVVLPYERLLSYDIIDL